MIIVLLVLTQLSYRVNIGPNAVIGAGAVVMDDIEPNRCVSETRPKLPVHCSTTKKYARKIRLYNTIKRQNVRY